jgi:hypothetical protein
MATLRALIARFRRWIGRGMSASAMSREMHEARRDAQEDIFRFGG